MKNMKEKLDSIYKKIEANIKEEKRKIDATRVETNLSQELERKKKEKEDRKRKEEEDRKRKEEEDRKAAEKEAKKKEICDRFNESWKKNPAGSENRKANLETLW